MTRHQYGISALGGPQTSFRWETSRGVGKCRLFSQALKTAIARVMVSCHYFFVDLRQYFITRDITRL